MGSEQSCRSGWAFQVEPDSGLSLSKCFGPISGLHITFFATMDTFLTIELITS